ncbi:MAG: fabH [Gammaproteobacteria bacterium]|jgi:3-oxoacyl-[acyl-carrier-protein] synthase-3|nr:fabH [Gammaproteobacteria bacterium]MCE3239198.1 fabH [Gammaproteobacteria bacterium]
MNYSKIIGTGSYLPKKILTNFDLEKMLDTSHDWIVKRTGIHQRHIAASDETALSMAEMAALAAMSAAGIEASDIGLIIIATTTPDKTFPSTACLLQQRLNIAGCPAFDLNSVACTGFVYAMSIADQFIRQGKVNNALVIGSEVMTRVVDWNDRSVAVLFGDGAAAVLLGKSQEPGILSTHLHADGTHKDILSLDTPTGYMQMKGNQLFKLAVNMLDDLFDETLAANYLQKSDIDWLVPHQANIRIIEAMAKKLDLSMERVIITLDKQGNTSAASIPLALDEAVRDKRIKRGDTLLLEGIGGGLTWGSALIKY